MAIRLIECHRVLKSTGTLYLHCDPTMSHYLKTTLDCIFGEENFRNEIVWHYGKMSNPGRNFPANHDTILRYTKTGEYTFNVIKGAESEYRNRYARYLINNQVRWGSVKNSQDKLILGRAKKVRAQLNKKHLDDKDVLFDFDKEFKAQSDVIYVSIIKGNSAERVGYPTQKPKALLKRLIEASSNEGDIVLDPFCGCATTCVAAEDNKRQWIGIDVSPKAYDLVKERLDREVAHPDALPTYRNEIHLKSNPPKRTDIGASMRKVKDVYIISHPKFPSEYKVGIAKNVKARLNSYQIGDPERSYKLEFSHKTHLYRQTEAHIHEHFENKHEWVRADLKDIKREILSYAGA